LQTGGPVITVDAKDAKELLFSLMDVIVREGEVKGGNLKLLQSLVARLGSSMQLSATALQRFWLYRSAENGSQHFVKLFCSLPDIKIAIREKRGLPIRELIESAGKGKTHRILVLIEILDANGSLELSAYSRDVALPAWQRVITDICSLRRANTLESRSKRMELIEKVIRCGFIPIDFETEQGQSDHHTIFSRAASEGDVELLTLLLARNVIKAPNRIQSNGKCALTAAIAEQQVSSVQIFTSPQYRSVVHVNVSTAEGRPLEVAKAKKVDQRIVQLLIDAGAS
jgi:hypothetical protein